VSETADLEPKTFDVIAFTKGRNYPEDTVTIYTDEAGAYELSKLDFKISRTNPNNPEAVETLERDREDLRERIKSSALKVHMRAVPFSVLEAIDDKVNAEFDGEQVTDEEKTERLVHSRLAAHIVSVTNASGQTDSRTWSADDIAAWDQALPRESVRKLIETMTALTFKATYFEEAGLNADF